MQRGFGIAGAVDAALAARLAAAAEAAGYDTFWANDTPGGDGLASLAAAAEVTTRIQLGVGVIPVDRQPAAMIAEKVERYDLPQDRLLVGIGSGGIKSGARAAVSEAAIALRSRLSARIVVGALGPRMCELSGRDADGALLNWLIPSYVPESCERILRAASEAGRPTPWIGAYVRVALTGPASQRLEEEAARYASYPQYAAHFARMGVDAIETCVHGDAAAIQTGLAAFNQGADEIVVRAIAADESESAYLDVLYAAAPGATTR